MRRPSGTLIKRLWLVGVLVYALLRTGAIAYFLREFGVNPWIYLAIDGATSYPFGVYSARLVEVLIAGEPAWIMPAAITALSYLAPDIYLMAALHHAPSHIYLITLGVVLSLSAITALILARRVKQIRAAA